MRDEQTSGQGAAQDDQKTLFSHEKHEVLSAETVSPDRSTTFRVLLSGETVDLCFAG